MFPLNKYLININFIIKVFDCHIFVHIGYINFIKKEHKSKKKKKKILILK